VSELPENHPLVEQATFWLTSRLMRFYGREFNQATEDQLTELLTHVRATFKKTTGHDFPPLTVLMLPTSQYAGVYRADLDDRAIGVKVLNLLRELGVAGRPVREMELAAAIRFAWPWYKVPIEDWRKDRQGGKGMVN
jgi:hypothetical protein